MATRCPASSVMARVLPRLDQPPWSALYRLLIGVSVVPLFRWSFGQDGTLLLLPFFLFMLLMLRLVPAAIRRLVSAPDDVQAEWARQRMLAKRFDSYQWRKLLWFGLGLAAYVVAAEHSGIVEGGLAGACVLAGAMGAWKWRRLGRSVSPVREGGRPAGLPTRMTS